jgi:hypothetical protein
VQRPCPRGGSWCAVLRSSRLAALAGAWRGPALHVRLFTSPNNRRAAACRAAPPNLTSVSRVLPCSVHVSSPRSVVSAAFYSFFCVSVPFPYPFHACGGCIAFAWQAATYSSTRIFILAQVFSLFYTTGETLSPCNCKGVYQLAPLARRY